MRTLSLDLRERILFSYDREEGTRAEIAHRFRVSLGMVKKLLQQRRRTGDISPRHHFAGRKPFQLFAKPLVIWSGTWKYTPQQIGQVTGLPQGTVATRYRSALAKIRSWLGRQE